MQQKVLVAFDFDLSLINEDSDIFVFQALCPQLLVEAAANNVQLPVEGYSKLSDEAYEQLHERRPDVKRAQILDLAARFPIAPSIVHTIKQAVKQYDATVVIISDSNDLFIRALLEAHDLKAYVSEIHSNGGHWEGERLRITPYIAADAAPHGCSRCLLNLCKGTVLDALREKHSIDKVLYVGDGGNDFCPATRATSHDTVFARGEDASGQSFDLLKAIHNAPDAVTARVAPWTSSDDLAQQLDEALQAN